MKVPAWGYVVGIIMLLMGGFGIIKNLQYINSPSIIELQKETLDGLTKDIRIRNADSTFTQIDISKATSVNRTDRRKLYNNIATTLYEVLNVSEFTLNWFVRFGYIGMLFSILKMVGGTFFMMKRSFSYVLGVSILILSFGFNIIQFMIFGSDFTSGILSLAAGYLQLCVAIINLILIVIVLASDKTAYFNLQRSSGSSL